jgi:hypothetical protein
MEFKAFPKIENMGKVFMQITQKIHGTNAQVFIYPETRVLEVIRPGTMTLEEARLKYPNSDISLAPATSDETWIVEKSLQLICGSRTRWIYPGDDNYGFAAFVHSHKEEFIQKLGPGQHFGEWAGLRINSGEGLDHKVFVLFDFWKYPPERPLPPGCVVVPVLYQGKMDLAKIDEVMEDLKTNGSKLAPGFMRPEGVVVMAMGVRYKKVFKAEETAWKKGDEKYAAQKQAEKDANFVDYSHLCQPIRLEKLLSRDERHLTAYPRSLPHIVDFYFEDLIAEGQITGSDEFIKGIRKQASGQIFQFVRELIEAALTNNGSANFRMGNG